MLGLPESDGYPVFIIVIGVAAQGFIVDKDFPKRAMAVAISLVVLGLFGFLATAKYYERFRMSMSRVGRLREELDRLHADLKLDESNNAPTKSTRVGTQSAVGSVFTFFGNS
jgi:hypothetical protein